MKTSLKLLVLVFFFSLALCFMLINKTSASPLIGLTFDSNSARLSAVDPTTGLVTNAGPAVPTSGFAVGTQAFDPGSNRYYFRGNGDRLITLDGLTGGLIGSSILTDPATLWNFEPGSGFLVGLSVDYPNPTYVSKANPTNGMITTIGSALPTFQSISSSHAIDTANNTYFFVASQLGESFERLFTVNTQTGAVIGSPSLSDEINFLHFDPTNNNLIGLSISGGTSQPARVDPTTGIVTKYASLLPPSILGSHAFNPITQSYYFTGTDFPNERIYTVDAQTGALISNQILSEPIRNLVALTHSPVPEPSTILLLGTGLVGLIGYSRRRRNA